MQVHCLSLLPVSRVTALCFKSEAFINAASLCIHFENSFCLKRKTNFDINSMRILYDKLFKAEMEELAEKLHSVILNTERKLAALSDSESTGSSKSRTNSFIEKNTSEKIPNHKIENPAITHYNNVNGNTLDVDGSLELFVNQNEDVRTADIETKVTDFKIAMGDVITESDRPDLVAFSNFKELGNAESSNNARFDTDDSDKVQNDHQGLGLDEIKVTSQDISAMRPVYKSSDLPQENLEQQNNSLNILTHNQQLEKGEKLICDMEDDKQLDVNEEMNIIENLEGSAQIQVEKANRDLVNTHTAIGAYTIEADTETIHVNGDEDSCMVKEIEDNIRTVIKSEADKEMSETDNGDLGNVVTTHIESVTAETLENISVNEDQGSERELDTIISHVSVIDTDLIKNQSENEMQSNHFENKINKDNETSADFGHLVVRAKSPAYTEYSPIRSKSPAPSTSSLKSNSSRKSGDLDDILEDDLDLIQSRSSNMGSRRLSLTSLSSLSSAEVVLEQVAGSK